MHSSRMRTTHRLRGATTRGSSACRMALWENRNPRLRTVTIGLLEMSGIPILWHLYSIVFNENSITSVIWRFMDTSMLDTTKAILQLGVIFTITASNIYFSHESSDIKYIFSGFF